MNLTELLDGIDGVDGELRATVDDLVRAKSRTRELGVGEVPAVIRGWVERQFAAAARYEFTTARPPDRQVAAADGFRAMVHRWAPP